MSLIATPIVIGGRLGYTNYPQLRDDVVVDLSTLKMRRERYTWYSINTGQPVGT